MLSKIKSWLGMGPAIVQFPDGKFAVRVSTFPFTEFADRSGRDTWYSSGTVHKYCKLDTYDEAVLLRNQVSRTYKVIK